MQSTVPLCRIIVLPSLHGWGLHFWLANSFVPSVQFLFRVCSPVPHVLLHSVHSDHSDDPKVQPKIKIC